MAFFLLSLSDKGKLNLIKLHHTTVGFLFAKRGREKPRGFSNSPRLGALAGARGGGESGGCGEREDAF